MITLRGVTVTYEEAKSPSLIDLNLDLPERELILVLGRSGSGKSTLGKVLTGIVPHVERAKVSGHISVLGLDPRLVPIHEMCRVAIYVAQSPYDQVLFSRVQDELEFTLENMKGSADPEEVQYYLSLLGLNELRNCKVNELSGGQLQRLIIACALAAGSRILVLDEPFAHLDPEASRDLRRVLESLVELGRTVILIEHRFREVVELIDRGIVSKVVLLDRGRVVRILEPEDLCRDAKLLESFSVRLPINVKLAIKLDLPVRSLLDFTVVEKVARLVRPYLEPGSRDFESTSDPSVLLDSVWAGYKRTGRSVLWVLRDINITFARGRVYAVIGRNGSGKSTLLLAIIGAVPHMKGKVVVCSKRVRGIRSVSGLVSYVPQNPDLIIASSTVRQELMMRAKLWVKSKLEAERVVVDIARRLELQEILDKNPHALSRGQRFRVALAAVLAQNTPIVLLDEPTSGQDEECVELLGEILSEEAKSGKTIILVTHDLDFVHDYADVVIVLRDGQIVAQGAPTDVIGNPEIMSKCGLPTCQAAEVLYRIGLNVRQKDLLQASEKAQSRAAYAI